MFKSKLIFFRDTFPNSLQFSGSYCPAQKEHLPFPSQITLHTTSTEWKRFGSEIYFTQVGSTWNPWFSVFFLFGGQSPILWETPLAAVAVARAMKGVLGNSCLSLNLSGSWLYSWHHCRRKNFFLEYSKKTVFMYFIKKNSCLLRKTKRGRPVDSRPFQMAQFQVLVDV